MQASAQPASTNRRNFSLARVAVALVLVLAGVAAVYIPRARAEAHRHRCINNMRQLTAAAGGWSLETQTPGCAIIKPEIAAEYMKELTICPSGKRPYEPFVIFEGPRCPNGHGRLGPGPLPPWSGSAVQFLQTVEHDLRAHGMWSGEPVLMRLTPELLDDPQVLEFMARGLAQWYEGDAACAVEALRRTGSPRVLPLLVTTIERAPSWPERPMLLLKVIEALSKIGDDQAIAALNSLTGNSNAKVRQAASEAVKAIQDRIGQAKAATPKP